MEKADIAKDTFQNGFNCAQAVLSTFSEELGLDKETALKLSTCFGGGMRSGEVCGAVTGALMVLGLKWGHFLSTDTEAKTLAYSKAAEFMQRFKQENNTVVCRELLGYDLSIPSEKKKIDEQNLFTTVCPKMIASAVTIVGEMLKESE